MILDSFDRYGEVRHFDPVTGTLGPTTASSVGTRATHGHYGQLGHTSVLFYRIEETLWLRIGKVIVPLQNTFQVTHNQVSNRRVLEVINKTTDALAARVEYNMPEPIVAPENDLTAFAEPEDFDFGLFISNVANDRQRQSRIYRNIE